MRAKGGGGAVRALAGRTRAESGSVGRKETPDRQGPPVGDREGREEGAEMGRKQEELGRREENWAGRKRKNRRKEKEEVGRLG